MFCQYYFSDKIAMFAMHAKEVTPEQAPELHGVIDRLCALADMPKPRVAIAETDVPNAFATGRSPKAAVVCATSGLLRRLDEPEIEAVLAHEISHVAHRDVAVMTIASGLGMIAGLLTRVMFYSELFGGGRSSNNNNSGGQLVIIEMVVMLVSIVVYFISFLLTMALSRYRELAADRSGAILIGRPSLLASALVKISGEMGRIPTKDLRAAEPFNAFFFVPALAQGRTHRTGAGQGGRLQLRQPVPHPPHARAPAGPARRARAPARPSPDLVTTWVSSTPCWGAPSRSRPTSMRCSPCRPRP